MDATTLQLFGIVVQATAILGGAGGVVATIFWNSKIAKRRATLDVLLQSQSTDILIANRTRFAEIVDDGDMAQWADSDKVNTDDAGVVRSALNRYELIAVGVHTGALDEAFYKRWYRSTLVKDWIAVRPLVERIRSETGNPNFYSEFNALAKVWSNDDEFTLCLNTHELDLVRKGIRASTIRERAKEKVRPRLF